MRSSVCAIVLAAGKGTRMKSHYAKVLHEVFFRPMIHHVLDATTALALGRTVVVTGYKKREVETALQDYDLVFAHQEEQLGTGHAILVAEPLVDSRARTILILCGDTPLIRPPTLARLLDQHRRAAAILTVMTTRLDDPTNYGRIVTDLDDGLLAIVEEKDAGPDQRLIKEINAGIYCVNADFLFDALRRVGSNNSQGEVYLTDIVAIAVAAGHKVDKFVCEDPLEVLGVNSRVELALAHGCLQTRRNRELMLAGVTMLGPESIAVEQAVEIGSDTVIHPNVFIGGHTRIGRNCVIESCTSIRDCRVADHVKIRSHSYLDRCVVVEGESIGPFVARTEP